MQIASGSLDNTLIIWDAHKHVIIKGPLTGHTGPVHSVTYSLNGTYILSGSEDPTIIIWDPITGTHQGTLKGHRYPPLSIACSPTRLHAASGSYDNTIQVWDLETSKPICEPLQVQHNASAVVAVAYSMDGNYIISAYSDMAIRIWNCLTGTLIKMPFICHTGTPFTVATSPDGKHIISGGSDGLIRVWDPQLDTPTNSTEPLKSYTKFIQSRVSSYIVKSALGNTSETQAFLNLLLCQVPHIQSFWDPSEKHFESIQLPQTRIDEHQNANESSDEPDQEVKEIQITHSSHPMVLQGDGWLYTVDGGLLTCVPKEHWVALCDMSVMCIPNDAQGCPIRLDWDAVYNAWDNIRKMMEESEQEQS